MNIGHVFDAKIFFILPQFFGDFLYSIALAQDFHKNCPRAGISFSVEENGVVAPIIEVKVLDQVREESHLEVPEGNEKKHWRLRFLIDYFELPKKQGNLGDDVNARISPIDSKPC